MSRAQQKIPAAGAEREALRAKGQFWTPDWVAEAMLAYVLKGDATEVFDPAVGAGAFFRAAKKVAGEINREVAFSGNEVDIEALGQAHHFGLSADELAGVEVRDFLSQPPPRKFKAIVANPPYIRHHRLSSATKMALKKYSASLLGKAIDGRAGLHIYFLLRALELLDRGGRLAFIMPADTCEGVFAQTLWRWITGNYRLEAVVTFSPDASPFPTVDTNPVIFMIRNDSPQPELHWIQCHQPQTSHLKEFVAAGFQGFNQTGLSVLWRSLEEGLTTGLSRTPVQTNGGILLGDFAKVMRGIATGANAFFFLTAAQAKAHRLDEEFLVPAIGRTRDVTAEEITFGTLEGLQKIGRPTLLFSPDGRPLERFPVAVREYLKKGEAMNLDAKPLIATRRPWYKMETRKAPPILFAYLGRRNIRFIRNRAGVMPLTGFLCVYPNREEADYLEKLWQVLRHPETIASLSLVGKSYGDGAIKVEPRALERLPLPEAIVLKIGLKPAHNSAQLSLY